VLDALWDEVKHGERQAISDRWGRAGAPP
jgi:hypothetical protein